MASNRPIRFHSHSGDNIELSNDNTIAERKSSYKDGITFSDKPLKAGELFLMQIDGVSPKWIGCLRIGLTQKDPNTHFPLPKYACPDLTNTAGTWAKSFPGFLFTGGDAFKRFGSLVQTPKGLLRWGDLLPFGCEEQKVRYLGLNKENLKFGELGSRIGIIIVPIDSAFANIHFIINGVDVLIYNEIPYAEEDLYVIVDVYGGTTKVRIVDYAFREGARVTPLSKL